MVSELNEVSQEETLGVLTVGKYAPRPQATTIPTAAWDASPLFCLKLNDEWVSHVIGVLTALDQPDTWLGDEDEVRLARQQVNEIILALMAGCNPMDNCCPQPDLTRVLEDGTYQVSYDGGLTWQDAGNLDPRNTAPQPPPLPGSDGDAKRCDAANNVLGQFKDGIHTFEGYFDTTITVIEFVSAVAAFIASLILAPLATPIIVSIIIGLFATIWNAGKTAYVAAFDDTVFGTLLCILYCNTQPDGTYREQDVDAILTRISADFDTIARDAFTALMHGVRAPGLNKMSHITTGSSASCDTCECPDCSLGGELFAFPTEEATCSLTKIDDCKYHAVALTPRTADGKYWITVATSVDQSELSNCVYLFRDNGTGSEIEDQSYWPCGSSSASFPVSNPSPNLNLLQIRGGSTPFELDITIVPAP